jgi:hypothetical protein
MGTATLEIGQSRWPEAKSATGPAALEVEKSERRPGARPGTEQHVNALG